MRKYLRALARYRMTRAGITQMNKKKGGGKSYFALSWREYARATR